MNNKNLQRMTSLILIWIQSSIAHSINISCNENSFIAPYFIHLKLSWKKCAATNILMNPQNHRWNYRVINLIIKKYGNLPLCLEHYALFSLPPILKNIYIYTYKWSNIIYLGEPLGNIVSNYHGTCIHIFIHVYYHI